MGENICKSHIWEKIFAKNLDKKYVKNVPNSTVRNQKIQLENKT